MRFPRFTVREMMAAIAAAGLALWLGSTAWRVYQQPNDQIVHIMQDRDSGALWLPGHSIAPSFWPHYRRALFGQSCTEDYPCDCRLHPHPGMRELASARDSNSLLPVFNRISIAYQRACEHKIAVESLGKSIARDEHSVKDSDPETRAFTERIRGLQKSEWERKTILDGIARNRKSLERHERLYRLYHAAAVSPTLLTDPEVMEPK